MRRETVLRWAAVLAPPALAITLGACSWDVGKLFDRDDPKVEQARRDLEASVANADADLSTARADLEELLRFRCEADGGHDLVLDRPGASLDLGLVIFRVAELVGQRFGDEESDAGAKAESIASTRAQELDCAHLLLEKLVKDPKTPPGLALRARYLLGNFAFLARRYRDAVDEYDGVLVRHPARGETAAEAGAADDDDAVARDAAWNRAIALKRLEDEQKKDAGNDADAPDSQDAQDAQDAADASDGADGSDAGDSGDSGDGGDAGDAGDSGDGGDGGDRGQDAASDGANEAAPPPPPTASASATPRPMGSTDVDLRELDRFDKKVPLDLELPTGKRPRLPRSLDK